MEIQNSNAPRQIGLIAQQELALSFASKRGLFVSGVFVTIWTLLLFYPIRFSADAMQNPDTSSLMLSLLSLVGLEPLKSWQLPEFALYWVVALFLLPAFCLLMATDQMISERNRGGLRFLTLRSSRGQIFFGRFLGHLLIQTCLILATLLVTYLLSLLSNGEHWLDGLILLPLIFINLILVIIPFLALMSLLSVVMTSVRMALLVALLGIFFGAILINYFASYVSVVGILIYLIPGIQLVSMAKETPDIALISLWLPLLQGGGFLTLGWWLFKRQEI
jgi:ABC-type transport system involved in multi-copper enzyme maturation permease subunit